MKHGVSIVADLTKSEDLPRAVQETIDKLGGLDILVNKYELYWNTALNPLAQHSTL